MVKSKAYKKYKRFKKSMKKKKYFGVPVGYNEDWKYVGKWSEKKIRPGTWRFRFRATKRRKATSYGSFGKGTTGVWDIKGKQYIRKTGLGQYQTDFRGIKKAVRFNVKKPYKKGKF